MSAMSSICTLASGNKQTVHFVMQFIYAMSFCSATIKLLIYFQFGENIPNAFRQLKNSLEELYLTNGLSSDDWKQWITIKEMEIQFNFSVMDLFKIRRATVLIIASFILQYAIILIQTNV